MLPWRHIIIHPFLHFLIVMPESWILGLTHPWFHWRIRWSTYNPYILFTFSLHIDNHCKKFKKIYINVSYIALGKSWLQSNLEKGYLYFQQKDEVLWSCHAPRLSGKLLIHIYLFIYFHIKNHTSKFRARWKENGEEVGPQKVGWTIYIFCKGKYWSDCCWSYQAYRWQKDVECSLGCHTCACALMWSERQRDIALKTVCISIGKPVINVSNILNQSRVQVITSFIIQIMYITVSTVALET